MSTSGRKQLISVDDNLMASEINIMASEIYFMASEKMALMPFKH